MGAVVEMPWKRCLRHSAEAKDSDGGCLSHLRT